MDIKVLRGSAKSRTELRRFLNSIYIPYNVLVYNVACNSTIGNMFNFKQNQIAKTVNIL